MAIGNHCYRAFCSDIISEFKVVLFLESEEDEVGDWSWRAMAPHFVIDLHILKPSGFFKAVQQQKPREDTWGLHRMHCLFETDT